MGFGMERRFMSELTRKQRIIIIYYSDKDDGAAMYEFMKWLNMFGNEYRSLFWGCRGALYGTCVAAHKYVFLHPSLHLFLIQTHTRTHTRMTIDALVHYFNLFVNIKTTTGFGMRASWRQEVSAWRSGNVRPPWKHPF